MKVLSNIAFALAFCVLVAVVVIATAFSKMQGATVVLLIGFSFFATLGAFLAAEETESPHGGAGKSHVRVGRV